MTDKQLSELMIITGLMRDIAEECKDIRAKNALIELSGKQKTILATLFYSIKK